MYSKSLEVDVLGTGSAFVTVCMPISKIEPVHEISNNVV